MQERALGHLVKWVSIESTDALSKARSRVSHLFEEFEQLGLFYDRFASQEFHSGERMRNVFVGCSPDGFRFLSSELADILVGSSLILCQRWSFVIKPETAVLLDQGLSSGLVRLN